MGERAITDGLWQRIDDHLSRREVMQAFLLYREATDCGISEGKCAIGERFRERFPQLWAVHRNVEEDD